MFARRATSAALALTGALTLSACIEADNGNNTLAYDTTATASAPATAPGAPASTGPAELGDQDGGIEIEAKDHKFVPDQIAAKAGRILIVMDNTGQAPHTFTQSELGVDVNADAGKSAEFTLEGVKPGTYHFICKYHEAAGMVGDLVVT